MRIKNPTQVPLIFLSLILNANSNQKNVNFTAFKESFMCSYGTILVHELCISV